MWINCFCFTTYQKRFFEDVKIESEEFDNRLYFLEILPSGKANLKGLNEAQNIKIIENKDEDFTSTWSFSEAIMKCMGEGFLSASRIKELSVQTKTQIYQVMRKSDTYTLSIAIKKVIM